MARILVIDDEASIRNTLREILEYEKFQVEEARNGHEAVELAKAQYFDAVLCDIKMPGMDGLEVLEQLLVLTDAPVIMISGHGTIDTAVKAIKLGAYDYIAKPLDLNRLLVTIRNALDKSNLQQEATRLRKQVEHRYEMVGESDAIREVKEMIRKVAPTEASVLITGANGTGKELVARQVHALSRRADGPFVEVNCAAIPSELIESQLFGHEKGSFTSAVKQFKGAFERADGGTLFLDEIGDMSLDAQAKVLRALQEHRITRVGGDREIQVDVRVVAATNKNVREEIQEKRFREDLYHRLSVIIIHLPLLKDREGDIPILVRRFLEGFCTASGKPVREITEEAMERLTTLPWSGNIRELKNVIERLVILCPGPIGADEVKKYAGVG